MIRGFFALLILSFIAAHPAAAGDLRLVPAEIDAGGAALVEWSGSPPVGGEVRFTGTAFPLVPTPAGAFALIAADLDLEPGRYPLEITLNSADGSREVRRLSLTVRRPERREERLTLPAEMVTPRAPEVVARIAREQKRLGEVFAGVSQPVLYRGFALPVSGPMGSPFGLRRILNGQPRSPHAGVDFRSPRGTPVAATARGRVVVADDFFFTGRMVVLDHGGGLFSLYAHLDEFRCAEGDLLAAGETLGLVGSSGRSTGPHLHWGVKLLGRRVNPLALVSLLPGEKP